MSCAHGDSRVAGNCPVCLLELAAGDDPELAAGTIVAGRFRIVAPLGRGGMGEVYRADDLTLGHPVALKLVAATEETLREVRAGREIAHPNVCRLYDIFDLGGSAAIVMEYVEGEDLSSLRLSHQKALEVARDVCSGLQAIHERGIAHGDLKPSNVMVDARGRARITDLGLSHRADEPSRFGGTPAFMAPEQFETRAATPQSDVYALGLLLSELIGDHEIVARCLRRNPAERPAAREVLAAIDEMPSPEYVAASEQTPRLSAQQAWAVAAAALGLLVLLFALSPRPVVGAQSAEPPRVPRLLYVELLTLTLAVGAVLAWRNLRAGRVDRSGAARVALLVFVSDAAAGILTAHHSPSLDAEATLLTEMAARAALLGAEVWVAYAALEPYVRRSWPHALVSWMRLLRRRVADLLVARDLLIGTAAGLATRLLELPRGSQAYGEAMTSMRFAAGALFHSLARGVFYALFALFLLVLLRMALRRPAVAAIVWLAATTAAWSRGTLVDVPIVAAQMTIILLALQRLGLLAAAAAIFVHLTTLLIPLTVFPQAAVVLVVLAAMILDGLKPVLHWAKRSSRVM